MIKLNTDTINLIDAINAKKEELTTMHFQLMELIERDTDGLISCCGFTTDRTVQLYMDDKERPAEAMQLVKDTNAKVYWKDDEMTCYVLDIGRPAKILLYNVEGQDDV